MVESPTIDIELMQGIKEIKTNKLYVDKFEADSKSPIELSNSASSIEPVEEAESYLEQTEIHT
jgi:hypothetical protein